MEHLSRLLRSFAGSTLERAEDLESWVVDACNILESIPSKTETTRDEPDTVSLREVSLTTTLVRVLLDCTVVPRIATGAYLVPRDAPSSPLSPSSQVVCRSCALSLELEPAILVRVLEAICSLIRLSDADTRLRDLSLPRIIAGAFCLRRCASYPGLPQSLTKGLPVRVLCSALLQVLWGRWLVPFRAAALPTSGTLSSNTAAYDDAVSNPLWLRAAAAAELSRVLSSEIDSVEGCLDAVFDSVDVTDVLASDRAIQLAALTLSRPPLEVTDAESYYANISPQLLRLLGLAGHRAHLLCKAATVTIAQCLALPPPLWRPVLQHLLLPLLQPLFVYTKGQLPQSWPSVTEDSTDVELASEDSVVGCIERLHRLLCGDTVLLGASLNLPASSYLQENGVRPEDNITTSAPVTLLSGRALHVFASILPSLFDLLTVASSNRLLAGFTHACEDVLVAVFRAMPPRDAAEAVFRIFQLHKCSLPVQPDESERTRPTSSAPLWSRLLVRHPSCRFVLGSSAGFRVVSRVCSGVGAASTAVALTDDEAIIGLSPNPSLLSARQRHTHSRTPLTQRRAQPGLADLLNIVDVGGSRGGDHMAPGHSVGLDAGLLGNPLPSLWARRSNICVDLLVRLERVSHGSTPKDASVAALIFSVLFPYYCKTVLNVGEERSHTGHQKEKTGSLSRPLITVISDSRVTADSPCSETLATGIALETSNSVSGSEDPNHDVRAMQLVICLCERLGSKLLRSSIQALQCVRSVLHMCIVAARMPLPSPSSAGAGAPGSLAHRICDEAAASIPARINDPPSALSQEEIVELVSLSLGLLSGVIGLPSGLSLGAAENDLVSPYEEDEEIEESETHEGFPRLDGESLAWVRSLLPLLAALSARNGPLDPTDEVCVSLYASMQQKGVPDMADALRAIILVLPDAQLLSKNASLSTSSVSNADRPLASQNQPQPARHQHLVRVFRNALDLTLDPTPAVQAYGLRSIAQLTAWSCLDDWKASLEPSGAEENEAPALLLVAYDLLMQGLTSLDSYVYLAAVEALRVLAVRFPRLSLSWLLRDYEVGQIASNRSVDSQGRLLIGDTALKAFGSKSIHESAAGAEYSTRCPSSESPASSLRTRVKIGEALYTALRATHRRLTAASSPTIPEVALVALRGRIITVYMRLGPQGWRDTQPLFDSLLKLAPDRASNDVGDEAGDGASVRTHAYNVALDLADRVDLRSSAIALLGSLASLSVGEDGGWYGLHAIDVINSLCGVLQFEQPPKAASNTGVETNALEHSDRVELVTRLISRLRRAAVHALSCICTGSGLALDASFKSRSTSGTFGNETAQHNVAALLAPLVHCGQIRELRDILFSTATDVREDPVTRQHASDALDGIRTAVPGLLCTALSLDGHGGRQLDASRSSVVEGLLSVVSSRRLLSISKLAH